MGRMMMDVMVAHEHDVSAYFDLSAAVKRGVAHVHAFRPTTSSSAGAINRDVALPDAVSQ